MSGIPPRWAVVTGAARGIGAAIADRLARDGFDLVLFDGPPDTLAVAIGYSLGTRTQLAGVAQRCRSHGVEVVVAPGDVRDEGALAAAVKHVPTGHLHAAVAVAGIIAADKPAWTLSREDLNLDLDVNLHGVANLARTAVPALLVAAGGSGRFVAVVSTAAETALPRLASYVASKHAALGFVRSLAADLGPLGVTANAVLPGSTRTALLERSARVYGLSGSTAFAVHQRLGRLIEPDEVAAAVSWLCGPDATAVTGAAIRVDGGFVG